MYKKTFGIFVSALLITIIKPSAKAEWLIEGYAGITAAENSDLRLEQPGNTSLTFHDLAYDTHDFAGPMYYGYRILYFPESISNWGFGIEFTHSKVYMNVSDSAHVTGTRAGSPVDAVEPLSDTFDGFNISNGINYLTADVLYRFYLDSNKDSFLRRFQPYVGIGLGITVPHPEVQLKDQPVRAKYEFGGFAAQALAGVSFDLTKHLLIFTEYKFSYANLHNLEFAGGHVSIDHLFEHHWAFGMGVKF